VKPTCEITVVSDIGLDGSGFSYWQELGLCTGPKPNFSLHGVPKVRNFGARNYDGGNWSVLYVDRQQKATGTEVFCM